MSETLERQAVAVVDQLGRRGDPDCYKEFKIGKTAHKRYSQKAVQKIEEALKEESAAEIWKRYRAKTRRAG